MTVALTGGSYRVVVDPAQGGAILSVDWLQADGTAIAVLEPVTPSLPPFKAGCFALIPFANRIADGRFSFEGKNYAIPVNNPAEGMAIHGFSRGCLWQVTSGGNATLILEQDFEQSGIPWRYHARQEIDLSERGVTISLTVRNDGEIAMPFGIGLHPWFHKTPRTTLTFTSAGVLGRDARGLPVMPARPEPAFDSDAPAALGSLPSFDGFFREWEPRRARLERPEDGLTIALSAEGAFRHLQVYVPDDRPVVCAEPVSHAPDAINRPALGAGCAMQVLAPGASLSGAMTLHATPLEVEYRS